MKTDKRITKTENAIRSAFSILIGKKELNKITVTELCRAAGINKSTFYLHYHDIYDLSKKMDDAIIQEISHIFSEYDDTSLISNSAEIARRILTLFNGEAPLYFTYTYSPTLGYLLNNADKYITDVLIDTLQKKQPVLSEKELAAHKLNITFIINGYIGLIRRYSIDELSDEELQSLATSLANGFLPVSSMESK